MSTPSRTKKLSPAVEPWEVRAPLLENTAWLDYVRSVYTVDQGGYPFYSYLGINFTAEGIKNYKFYFAFHNRLSEADLDVVLPVANRSHFDRFYAEWHPSMEAKTVHRGTTFALKVDRDGTLTHYYHLRVKGAPFGPPLRLILGEVDRDNHHGVCEEFTGSEVNLKRYYYCRDIPTIAHSLRIAGMPNRTPCVDWLEYIESERRDKLTWVSKDQRLAEELVRRRGPPELGPRLFDITEACDVALFAPGSARDASDHSLYFFDFRGSWFDGVDNFAQRYLGLGTSWKRAPRRPKRR